MEPPPQKKKNRNVDFLKKKFLGPKKFKIVGMILSASIDRFSVYCMRDLFLKNKVLYKY